MCLRLEIGDGDEGEDAMLHTHSHHVLPHGA